MCCVFCTRWNPSHPCSLLFIGLFRFAPSSAKIWRSFAPSAHALSLLVLCLFFAIPPFPFTQGSIIVNVSPRRRRRFAARSNKGDGVASTSVPSVLHRAGGECTFLPYVRHARHLYHRVWDHSAHRNYAADGRCHARYRGSIRVHIDLAPASGPELSQLGEPIALLHEPVPSDWR